MTDDVAVPREPLEQSHTKEGIRSRLARDTRPNYLRAWIYDGPSRRNGLFLRCVNPARSIPRNVRHGPRYR